jgi:hypothetical protein
MTSFSAGQLPAVASISPSRCIARAVPSFRAVDGEGMAAKSGGRTPDWTIDKGRVRTQQGHNFYISINELLTAWGLKQSDKGALRRAIAELHSKPPYNEYELEALRVAYYALSKASPPPPDPRDHLISELQKFGMAPDASVALADRLIDICTVKIPFLGLDYVVRMISHVKRTRRLRTGESKIQWLKSAAERLDNPKPRFPIRPWDQASNANIEATKSALHDGLTAIDEIAARTGIKHRTQQELLCFLQDIGEARRFKHGGYGPPQEGAPDYVRTGEVVLKVLESGPASPEKIQLCGNLTEAQATGAIHWLWKKAKKIRRPEPNLYSLPGPGVTDHVYAHDAMLGALVLGKKSMPEIETITGKNQKELWAGYRRRLRPEGLAKQVGFLSGSDVRPGFRGRVAVFALTAKGRRQAGART